MLEPVTPRNQLDAPDVWREFVKIANRANQSPILEVSKNTPVLSRIHECSKWYRGSKSRWKYIAWPFTPVTVYSAFGLSASHLSSWLQSSLALAVVLVAVAGLTLWGAALEPDDKAYQWFVRQSERTPVWAAWLSIAFLAVVFLVCLFSLLLWAEYPTARALTYVAFALFGIAPLSFSLAFLTSRPYPLLNDPHTPSLSQWSKPRQLGGVAKVGTVLVVAAILAIMTSNVSNVLTAFFLQLVLIALTTVVLTRLMDRADLDKLTVAAIAVNNFDLLRSLSKDPATLRLAWNSVDAGLSMRIFGGANGAIANLALRYALDQCVLGVDETARHLRREYWGDLGQDPSLVGVANEVNRLVSKKRDKIENEFFRRARFFGTPSPRLHEEHLRPS